MPIYRRKGESIIVTPYSGGSKTTIQVVDIDLETRTATFGFSQWGAFSTSDPIQQGQEYRPQADMCFTLTSVQPDPKYPDIAEVVLFYEAGAPYRFESERRHAERTASPQPRHRRW